MGAPAQGTYDCTDTQGGKGKWILVVKPGNTYELTDPNGGTSDGTLGGRGNTWTTTGTPHVVLQEEGGTWYWQTDGAGGHCEKRRMSAATSRNTKV